MPPAAPKRGLSYEDYLALEERSEIRHEFFAGETYAMAGGTPEHSRLATVICASLEAQRRDRDCIPFGADLHVRTASGYGAYPDVTVVCGKLVRHRDADRAVTNPILIVEVLSESTESFDREGKFKHYRSIPSFREYVLVSFREPLIEAHFRNADGSWTTTFGGPGERVRLRSIESELDVDAIYAGMQTTDGRMVLEHQTD
jgi:Uma2 family endonuclease